MIFLFGSVIWYMNRSSKDLLLANKVSHDVRYHLYIFHFGFAIVSLLFASVLLSRGGLAGLFSHCRLPGFGVKVMLVS